MKTTLRIVTALALGLAGMTAQAADHAKATSPLRECKPQIVKAKASGAADALKEVTLTGSVTKQQTKIAGKLRAIFTLIAANGDSYRLPAIKVSKKSATAPIKLADYIGQHVKVVAMACEQKKGDKISLKVKQVKSVEKLTAESAAETPKAAA